MFTGVIEGVGPRYCPSIEDKVNRFADKGSHQIFLEPEGLTTHEFYPNGISTSLPFDVQIEAVHSIVGLEDAHILRPGYAIEYDYFDPRELRSSFETRAIGGLFFAGQINGTTGYEEAAAQGLFAGLNAALQVRGREPWLPRRDEAYLGVLVDDLITRGVTEPYRMFTSRAEYRLLLRQDNADLRFTALGRELGVVGDERWQAFSAKKTQLEQARAHLAATRVLPGTAAGDALAAALGQPLARDASLLELLRRPDVSPALLAAAVPGWDIAPPIAEQLETELKYEGYIQRQQSEVDRLRREEDVPLPADLDYAQVASLSNEVRQKLDRARPETLARAARIPGITQAALAILLIHLKNKREATG
jgi:tRNA uridine 5-carboxymethylaminomethyl modification enzyme